MNEFMEVVKDSFNESTNHLTWAFFSLVAAFMFDRALDLKGFKRKWVNRIFRFLFRVYFFLFLIIGTVNIIFISNIFTKNFDGSVWSNVFGILIMVMVVANAGLLVIGLDDKKSKDM
ncbi:hypothetical protein [Morganella morganii]|uniref:hypothetical protein n=1 Tax=Morganella morganii TaxID=582 RepID=UPI000D9C096F|nr:hypothetical protein [Morganella morganii]SPX72035.1 Uncharacterised protein [Morganella morganii]HCR4427369.1 hypothetical protein [Morganella morganii]HCT6323361.1 hypothetical protein [Morganella morganii]HDS6456892.1 hypothetical protein [Morganella morganii subsp. morganii]